MLDSKFFVGLYYVTFFAWVPLGFMAHASRKSRTRFGILSALTAISILVCAYVLYMDFIWSKTVGGAPIRLDLLLLIPAFSGLNLTLGLWGLTTWRARRSAVMLLSSVCLVLPAAIMFAGFWYSMRSAESIGAQIDSIPALLFEAQFKNADNFHKTFGDIDSARLAGHYQPERRSWATRVIINSEGHFWLYFTCGRDARTECVHSEATLDSGAQSFPRSISFHPQVGAGFEGEIVSEGRDRFTLAVHTMRDGVKRPYMDPVTFRRSPVPYRGSSQNDVNGVKYWGAFAQSTVHGTSVEPIQLWLWQENGPRFMAFYIRGNFECGKTHAFIAPQFIEGELKNGALMLSKPDSIESLTLGAMTEQKLTGSVWYGGRPFEDVVLRPKTVFLSDRFEVAPLANLEQTRTWLKTVSSGYMFTWNANCANF